MSELEFQKAFAKLLTDGDLRAAVATGGAGRGGAEAVSGASPIDLPEADLMRLRQMDRERVEIYAELLLMNRLSKAMEALPFTMKVLRDQLWPITIDFNRASPPVRSKKYDEAIAFARYLLDTIGTRPGEPPFLKDLLVYEMSQLELRFETQYHQPVDDIPDEETLRLLGELALGRDLSGIYPRQAAHCRLVALDYDVESLIQELEQDRVPEGVEPSPKYILMAVEPSGIVQQFEANLPTAAFLSAVSGEGSFADVLSWLAQAFQKEGPESLEALRQSCVELCASLVEQRLLTLTTERPACRADAPALN